MKDNTVTLERNTEKEDKDEEIVSLLSKGKSLDLSEAKQKEILKQIKDEFDAIKDERKDIQGSDFDSFLECIDNQKYGLMPKSARRAYNLDTGLTRIKCDDIKRSTVMALLDVEPVVSVSPRLGFALQNGTEICNQQQDFIDSVVDEIIPLRKPMMLAADGAIYKKVGIIKWFHKVVTEKRVRTECYTGTPTVVGQNPDGSPIIENSGLDDFLLSHSEKVKKDPAKYQWIVDKLNQGKEAKFDIEYKEVVYDDPFPVFVDNKNFYVRKSVDGYDGMCETMLLAERVELSYYDLKKLEKNYDFINLDKLLYKEGGKELNDDYATKMYKIMECVFYFKLKDEDEEYTKGVFWIEEDSWIYLGGINYPFTTIDCYYVPHYVFQDNAGFYQSGIAEQLTSAHLVKNAITNHTLEAAHMTTTVTPIVKKGTDASKQFMNRLWTNGMPIHADPEDIAFLSNLIKPLDTGSLLTLANEVGRIADEVSRSSGLRSGGETPLDPNAPAAKTAMLLEQSGKGVKDYIDVFKDGFNIDAFIIVRMYYEIGQSDDEYLNSRIRAVSGASAGKISRAALIARTNIQSQAMAYDFDGLNAARTALVASQFLSNEMLTSSNPEANYERVKVVMSTLGPKWKNAIPKILPPLDQFNQQQAQIAFNATIMYFKQMMEQAKITGQPPEIDPQALIAGIRKLQIMATAPKEVVQQMQEAEAQKGEAQ